jgi:hypothetical protein
MAHKPASFGQSSIVPRNSNMTISNSSRGNVIMKSTADNSIQGASSFNIGSKYGGLQASKITKSTITGEPSKIGGSRTQDQIYQYSSFGRGGAKGKRGGTALFAMLDDT